MNFETYLRAVLDCNLTEIKDEIKETIVKKTLEYKTPTAKWEITKSLLSDETIVRCSLCGDAFIGYQTEDYKYCPICGAKMEIEK